MRSQRLTKYIELAQRIFDALPQEEKSKVWKLKRTKALAEQDSTSNPSNRDIKTIQLTNGMRLTTDPRLKSKNRMMDPDGTIFYFTGPSSEFKMIFSFLSEPQKTLRIYENDNIFAKVRAISKNREKGKQKQREKGAGYTSVKYATFIDKDNHETIAKTIELDPNNEEFERLIQCIKDEVAINNDVGLETSITWRTIYHGGKKIIKATLFSRHLGESLEDLHQKNYTHRERFSIMLACLQQGYDLHNGTLSKSDPSNRYVHRDIKLGNFLIKRPLAPWPSLKKLPLQTTLIDFGFATKLDASTLQVTDTLMGTRGYLAPEIHQDLHEREHVYSFATDIYALGVTIKLQLVQFALTLNIFGQEEKERLKTWLDNHDFAEPIQRNSETNTNFSNRKVQYLDDLLFLSGINERIKEHLHKTSQQEAKVWNDLVNFSEKMCSSDPSQRPSLKQVRPFCTNLSKQITQLPRSSDNIDSDDETASVESTYSNTAIAGVEDWETTEQPAQYSNLPAPRLRSLSDSIDSSSKIANVNIQPSTNKAEKLKSAIIDAVLAYNAHHQPLSCYSLFSRHGSAGFKRASDLKSAIEGLQPQNLTIEAIKGALGDFFKQGNCFSLRTTKAANHNHSFIRFLIQKLQEKFRDTNQSTISDGIVNALQALEIENVAIPKITPSSQTQTSTEEIHSAAFRAISEHCMKEFSSCRTSMGV